MAEENVTEQEGGGGGSRLLMVLVLLHILGTGALGYLVFMNSNEIKAVTASLNEKIEREKTEDSFNAKLTAEELDSSAMGPVVDLGVIRVNLTGTDGRDYRLQTALSLEVDSEETRREAESKIIVIRFNIHKLLTAQRPQNVKGPEQMELLRKSMARTADAALASQKGRVLNVWPNDWIVE
jgi:flagellar basal body-associated protein FliL